MEISVGSLNCDLGTQTLKLPAHAMVDDLIKELSLPEGCAGFFATKRMPREDYYGYYDDDDEEPESDVSDLAAKLKADGGKLLEPGQSFSQYELDALSCKGFTFYPVFSEIQNQPKVFKKDVEESGLGKNVYGYVRLNPEDKEIAEARNYFCRPLLQWLQGDEHNQESGSGFGQKVAFSMEDDFPQAPKVVASVYIAQENQELTVSCLNMAGNQLASARVAKDVMAAQLRSTLCEQLQWPHMNLWNGSEKVPEAETNLAKYSVLTAEQVAAPESLCGSYHFYTTSVHPAGYSASGTSTASMLVLEPDKATLQYHFKGEYKRAEELKKVVMRDARWSIESLGEGNHAVRLVGEATLDRYFVHERSGSDGSRIQGYSCFAQVTIPLEQLEKGQSSYNHHSHSTSGSGWTCGSDSYRSSFFLPPCLLKVLRMKSAAGESDSSVLQKLLNSDCAPDYPHSLVTAPRRGFFGGDSHIVRMSEENFAILEHVCKNLVGQADISVDEIVKLEASAPKPAKKDAGAGVLDNED